MIDLDLATCDLSSEEVLRACLDDFETHCRRAHDGFEIWFRETLEVCPCDECSKRFDALAKNTSCPVSWFGVMTQTRHGLGIWSNPVVHLFLAEMDPRLYANVVMSASRAIVSEEIPLDSMDEHPAAMVFDQWIHFTSKVEHVLHLLVAMTLDRKSLAPFVFYVCCKVFLRAINDPVIKDVVEDCLGKWDRSTSPRGLLESACRDILCDEDTKCFLSQIGELADLLFLTREESKAQYLSNNILQLARMSNARRRFMLDDSVCLETLRKLVPSARVLMTADIDALANVK